ncbi:unnamed protein product [Arctia plantaginis]|uniref:Uncharacterized protein n=1 Tax=Arctia plantaginis TaxID=874455 RepID=A0A8S1B5L1_ARCPL|nr:unnamed protein product [Arctia plantaginis]
MSLLSVAFFLLFLMVTTVKADINQKLPQSTSSAQNFKEFVANIIQEQSSKIQTLLKKIQTNAQSVLEKIGNIKHDSKINKRKLHLKSYLGRESQQIESPVVNTAIEAISEARNFNNHYSPTGFGTSGSQSYGTPHSYGTSHSYGAPTYHHHSIGFDPINIVVSMSLLSFLLQALQGLLGRARLPTPVVEARELQSVADWSKKIDENLTVNDKDKYFLNKKMFKKYFPK